MVPDRDKTAASVPAQHGKRERTGSAPDARTPRISLLQKDPGVTTRLDGAWWPRSADLAEALPDLVVELRGRTLRMNRASYNPSAWAPAARKIRADGRTIHLGWFRSLDAHAISLSGSAGERLDLLVIPPDTRPDVASRAMELATEPGNRLSATEVLAASTAPQEAGSKAS